LTTDDGISTLAKLTLLQPNRLITNAGIKNLTNLSFPDSLLITDEGIKIMTKID